MLEELRNEYQRKCTRASLKRSWDKMTERGKIFIEPLTQVSDRLQVHSKEAEAQKMREAEEQLEKTLRDLKKYRELLKRR